jgi:hypothetical protein
MVYTAIGGGATGSDPVCPARRGRGAQGDADHQHDAAHDAAASGKQDVERQLRDALEVLPGVQVKVGLGGSSEKYVLVLAGENGALLPNTPASSNANCAPARHRRRHHEASLVRPELVVRPDFRGAADLGVTSAAIADTLRIATAGDYDQSLAKLNLSAAPDPHRRQAAAGRAPGLGLLDG